MLGYNIPDVDLRFVRQVIEANLVFPQHVQLTSSYLGRGEQSSLMSPTIRGDSTPGPTVLPSAPSRPPQSRRRNYPATVLKDSDWEPLKARMIQLYIDENMTIPSLQEVLGEEFGFKAT